MSATAYADTSLLASLYLADANTPAALAAVSAAGAPLLLTSWQQFELENAFQLRLFRRESTRADLASAEAHLIQDISAGMVTVVALPAPPACEPRSSTRATTQPQVPLPILQALLLPMSAFSDPLRDAREKSGVLKCPFHGEDITMILRHGDVRQAAKDWQTFSSDAPFRVPIPSEEKVRSMRQLPIETNPPEHGDYRAIVEPFFARAKDPAVIAQVEALIDGLLTSVLARDSVEIVNEFALPVQSRAHLSAQRARLRGRNLDRLGNPCVQGHRR